MAHELRAEKFTEQLANLYIELSKTEYTDHACLNKDYFIWKFLNHPEGACLVHNLYEGDALKGRIAYLLRRFQFKNQSFLAGCIVDLLIHPQSRGIKTFMQLISRLRSTEGMDFLYVVPGAGSLPLFEKIIKSRELFKLDVYIFPLRPLNLLRTKYSWKERRLFSAMDKLAKLPIRLWSRLRNEKDLSFSTTPPTPEAFQEFLETINSQDIMMGRRDQTFLNWRYHQSPYHKYEVTYLYKKGEFCGYFVTSLQKYQGYQALFVVDFLFGKKLKQKDISRIKKRIIHQGVHQAADLILILFNASHPLTAGLGSFPLIKVPESYLPQPVPLFFEGKAALGDQLNRHNVYVTAADLDVF